MKKIITTLIVAVICLAAIFVSSVVIKTFNNNKILKKIIRRLKADTRIAEVLVVGVNYDEKTGKNVTTIKFLEYDVDNNPLDPKYFTFDGNIIQFQSLVVRFEDIYIEESDRFKGKSAYLFWKVFVLDGANTQEYELTKIYSIPSGYKIPEVTEEFEEKLWNKFWDYVLNPDEAKNIGIKNVQIEAPGTMFVPAMIYTIKIEHDGGMRIDSQKVPEILKGEKVLN